MFHFKSLLLVAAAVAALPCSDARSFDLSDMINKTVCAIKVRYDYKPNRIPSRIKTITCAANTNQGCAANSIQHCCNENKMECVEMRDRVLVFDKDLNATTTIEVPVGCACMIHNWAMAKDIKNDHDR